jgi:hypothetical protein
MTLDLDAIRQRFAASVNLGLLELSAWLETEESRSVGQLKAGASDTVGRLSGRRILAILATPEPELTDDDYLFMRKVSGFVARHRAQEPANPVTSRWRYALMNWGHDPLKDPGSEE